MKVILRMDREPDHENLAILFNLAVAARLRCSLLDAGLEEYEVWPIVQSAVFDLASMIDHGSINVNGKQFKPRIAFADDNGDLLPGAAEFSNLHEYGTVFEDDLKPTEEFSVRV